MRFDAELNRERRLRRMRRGVVAAGELHRGESNGRAMMVTLTYRPDAEWRAEHISSALKQWRRELRGRRLKYVWVMELTKAGRPHYHVLIWSNGARLQKPDESGAWPHGWSRIEWARNPVGYLVKYATKGTDGQNLPRRARLFGVGGLSAAGRIQQRWRMLPKYIRDRTNANDRVRRMPGGGWVAAADGRWWPAEVFHEVSQVSGFFPVGTPRSYFEGLWRAMVREFDNNEFTVRVAEDFTLVIDLPERYQREHSLESFDRFAREEHSPALWPGPVALST